MINVSYHLLGVVVLHVNKDGTIVGIEVPPDELKKRSIVTKVHPLASKNCSRGLSDCCKELESSEVRYAIVEEEEANITTIKNVVIHASDIAKLEKDTKLIQSNVPCPNFDPISDRYLEDSTCTWCSQMETCYDKTTSIYQNSMDPF